MVGHRRHAVGPRGGRLWPQRRRQGNAPPLFGQVRSFGALLLDFASQRSRRALRATLPKLVARTRGAPGVEMVVTTGVRNVSRRLTRMRSRSRDPGRSGEGRGRNCVSRLARPGGKRAGGCLRTGRLGQACGRDEISTPARPSSNRSGRPRPEMGLAAHRLPARPRVRILGAARGATGTLRGV